MAHETGLMVVNTIQDELAELAQAYCTALKDGKVSTIEAMMLFMKTSGVGVSFFNLLKGLSTDEIGEVIYVLENMDIVLAENAQQG